MSNRSARLGVWSVLTIFPCFIATVLWSAVLLSCLGVPEEAPLWMGFLILLPMLISPGIGVAGLITGIRRWKEHHSLLGVALSLLGIAGNILFWYGFYRIASTH